MGTNIDQQKNIIRKKMLEQRAKLTKSELLDKAQGIQHIFNSLKINHNLNSYYMSYVNIGKEVETKNIIKRLLGEGKKVTVPLCVPKTISLIASQIYSLDELGPSQFGLLEPEKRYVRPINPEKLDIVLVPGLAFDKNMNRVGYGKGYYDSFLSKLPSSTLKIGLAYSFQIIDKVPTNDYDVPLNIVITENEIISF